MFSDVEFPDSNWIPPICWLLIYISSFVIWRRLEEAMSYGLISNLRLTRGHRQTSSLNHRQLPLYMHFSARLTSSVNLLYEGVCGGDVTRTLTSLRFALPSCHRPRAPPTEGATDRGRTATAAAATAEATRPTMYSSRSSKLGRGACLH